ncbi:hydroxyethylthiazole kinase [Puteibacter caeruleilacunae]|nr:hydroxyethylthiazole kinase [Puteibacter caeruleilacunae]
MIQNIVNALERVRACAPLVHNITNYVVMNNTANALLAIGASPVMAHAKEEVVDMVNIASSLVINMGTLSEKWIESMVIAGERAVDRGIPVVFDPVGVGATAYRTEAAQTIIERCKPTVIRGNASEIMALSNANVKTKGVDSTVSSDSAIDSARLLAHETNSVVVISGETDYITDGTRVVTVDNGSLLMPKVTGMGCTATAVIGAFAGANEDTFLATVAAMTAMGIAGEIATEKSSGPGSMQMNFLDMLYALTGEVVESRAKVTSAN